MNTARRSGESRHAKHFTWSFAVVAILVVPILFASVAVYSYSEVRSSFQRVLDDIALGGALREESQDHFDREAGLRGYTSTRDPRFLEPYTRAQSALLGHSEDVSRRLRSLGMPEASVIHERILKLQNSWDQSVDTNLLADPTGPHALYWQLRGKTLMDDTRKGVDEMRKIIGRDRDETTARTNARLRNLFVAALAAGVALTILAIWIEYGRGKAAAQFTVELEERARELERSNAALQDFAYAASHDLQEPLRMVSSYTQLLARRYKGKLDADADEFIGFAVDGAKRMESLIKDILAYSRVGAQTVKNEPVEALSLVEAAIANLKIALDESGASVMYDGLPTVLGDASQLTLVFQNLIGNALKYRSQSAPYVQIAANREGAQWVFAVKDNGIGIEPRHFERVFRMFGRLHTREEYPGTGIGLAIVKRIIEAHGGTIWVESMPGEGSTFFFTLAAAKTGTVVHDRDLARRG